jgi:hypothetical protein
MGLLRKTFYTGLLGSASCLAYLAAKNPVVAPLPATDPLWKSRLLASHNPSRNSATSDTCIRRIPLSKIRPELLDKDGDLVREFCRAVWSGWG